MQQPSTGREKHRPPHDGPDLAAIGSITTNIYQTVDPARRKVLESLLCEEENRFGSLVWQLEMANRYVSEANARIENQRNLVIELEQKGHDVTLPRKILNNMERVRDLFAGYQALIGDMLDLAEKRLLSDT